MTLQVLQRLICYLWHSYDPGGLKVPQNFYVFSSFVKYRLPYPHRKDYYFLNNQ